MGWCLQHSGMLAHCKPSYEAININEIFSYSLICLVWLDKWSRGNITQGSQWTQLVHTLPQHLVGCNEHDADDEGHRESTDEAFADARLPILPFRMH